MKARLPFSLLLATTLVSLGSLQAVSAAGRPDPVWPPSDVNTSAPIAGSSVSIEIDFAGSNATDETVYLSGPSGVFSYLPPSVILPAGHTNVTVTGWISSNAGGQMCAVQASNTVGAASSYSYLVTP